MAEIDIRKIFGENVKYYRKKAGLSQEQLAEKLEVSPNHLSVIETGGKFVTYKLLEKLISIFEVMPSALFYVAGTATNDDSIQNSINSIVKSELEAAYKEISQKSQRFNTNLLYCVILRLYFYKEAQYGSDAAQTKSY